LLPPDCHPAALFRQEDGMLIIEKQVDPHKTRCDDCGMPAPPIRECQFPYPKPTLPGEPGSQWIDLCPACIENRRADPKPFAMLNTFVSNLTPLSWKDQSSENFENSTNIYGPRPMGCGFRCMHCGIEDGILFGVALLCPRRAPREHQKTYQKRRATWEPESNIHTSCAACLSKCRLDGKNRRPTEDAREALEGRYVPETTHKNLPAIQIKKRRRTGS
jgi:hypothetical protein